jgi:hypothetical protein
MVRPAEIGEVVRVVVAAVLIEVRNHYARLESQAADNAAPELIGRCRYPACLALLTPQDRRDGIVRHRTIPRELHESVSGRRPMPHDLPLTVKRKRGFLKNRRLRDG